MIKKMGNIKKDLEKNKGKKVVCQILGKVLKIIKKGQDNKE